MKLNWTILKTKKKNLLPRRKILRKKRRILWINVPLISVVWLYCCPLLSFLFEMCLYYFIPQHLITVAVAAIISLGLAHFFLESSLNYDYCFLHASFMTITSTAFTIIVYLMQPNVWIAYDYSLIALIIVNWFIPFWLLLYPRFLWPWSAFCRILIFLLRNEHSFPYNLCNRFKLSCFLSHRYFHLMKQWDFGAHNFIPFMATGNYIEDALSHHASITKMITYILEMIVLGIPAGFYIRVFLRNHSITPRISHICSAISAWFIQFLTGIGRADIDDYTFYLIGISGRYCNLLYRISVFLMKYTKEDFLEDRTVVKKLWHFQDNY